MFNLLKVLSFILLSLAATTKDTTMATKLAGWSASGTLKTFDRNAGPHLQAGFGEWDTYTVQFAVARSEAQVARPKARVEYSIAGNTIVRVFDVNDGTSISGQASNVAVKLYDGSITGQVGTPNDDYDGTIIVTKGRRANPLPVTLLEPRYTLYAGGPAPTVPGVTNACVPVPSGYILTYNIPQGVGVTAFKVGVVSELTPLTPNNVRIQIANGAGTNPAKYSVNPYQLTDWIPLTPGATSVAILNNEAFTVDVTLTWAIDG